MPIPKWANDLIKYADGIAYGDLTPKIRRINNHTIEVEVMSIETLRYDDNASAVAALIQLLKNMEEAQVTGMVNVVFDLKGGKIETVGYKNTKTTRYQ